MGAYAYCEKCEGGMPRPTPAEAVAEVQRCPQCGHEHGVRREELADYLTEIMQRIEELEAAVRELKL